MIVIKGFGEFRHSRSEWLRALEVASFIPYSVSEPFEEWELQYGERPVATNTRIDAKISIKLKSGTSYDVGVEIVSNEREVEHAEDKLRYLITIGRIKKGYVYIRRIDDVERDTVKRLELVKEVI